MGHIPERTKTRPIDTTFTVKSDLSSSDVVVVRKAMTSTNRCIFCCFSEACRSDSRPHGIGYCKGTSRDDKTDVYFRYID